MGGVSRSMGVPGNVLMINLILTVFMVGVFYVGYKTGVKKTYLTEKWEAKKKQFRNWVRDHT